MTMVITVQCPSCATTFPVDPRKIPEKGVKVRCSSCSQIFRVERPAEMAPPAPPPPPPPPAPVVEAPPAPAAVTPPPPAAPEPPALPPAPAPAAPAPVVRETPRFEAPRFEAPAPAMPEPPREEVAPPAPADEAPQEQTRDAFIAWPSAPSAGADAPSTSLEEPADVAAEEAASVAEEAADELAEEVAATAEEAAGAAARAQLASGSVDDWVLETEDDLDAKDVEVESIDTVESAAEGVRDEVTFTEVPLGFETPTTYGQEPAIEEAPTFTDEFQIEVEPAPPVGAPPEAPSTAPETFTPRVPEAPPAPPPAPVSPPVAETFVRPAEPPRAPEPAKAPEPPPAPATGTTGVGAFTFGKRDPKDKARRLARVLVSDMIMYNPERHERALASGTLKEDFEDEIKKSWKEYVEQVGEEMARGNPFWIDALNDVLAKGQRVF